MNKICKAKSIVLSIWLLQLFSLLDCFLIVWTEQGEGNYKITGTILKISSFEWDNLLYFDVLNDLNRDNSYTEQWYRKIHNLYVAGWIFIAFEILNILISIYFGCIIFYEFRGKHVKFKWIIAWLFIVLKAINLIIWAVLTDNRFYAECKYLAISNNLAPSCFGPGPILQIIIIFLLAFLIYSSTTL